MLVNRKPLINKNKIFKYCKTAPYITAAQEEVQSLAGIRQPLLGLNLINKVKEETISSIDVPFNKEQRSISLAKLTSTQARKLARPEQDKKISKNLSKEVSTQWRQHRSNARKLLFAG